MNAQTDPFPAVLDDYGPKELINETMACTFTNISDELCGLVADKDRAVIERFGYSFL